MLCTCSLFCLMHLTNHGLALAVGLGLVYQCSILSEQCCVLLNKYIVLSMLCILNKSYITELYEVAGLFC